ncbi:MAG: hypothetical protein QOF51_2440 [Chloroflexota bacterium]|jgi:hypothetical protein|nr:hypothetical protein [Chloroflexota bacterium]
MNYPRRLLAAFLGVTALLTLWCGPGAPASLAAPLPQSSVTTGERKEVLLVKSVRPILGTTVAALREGDLAAARTAWAHYDGAWNGIEVYINFRSLDTYQDLEANWQAKITAAMAAPDADAAAILPMGEAILAAYDGAIAMVEAGPALSPLFDDIADVRIARAPLREVGPALNAGDLGRAAGGFTAFVQAWPTVAGLIALRSPSAARETSQAIAAVHTAWLQLQPNAAELTPLVTNVMARFNYGLALLNAAARNADLTRTTYAPADLQAALTVRAVEGHLRESLAAWEAGDFTAATLHASAASGQLNDPGIAGPLEAKRLIAPLRSAIDAYATASGSAGDVTRARNLNRAAIEAGEVAIQGLVGQFWTDPAIQAALVSAAQ